jgi:2-polyprenyl-6-methoxyphenol hydroxylase-like FAD-dependent oxidoreductase
MYFASRPLLEQLVRRRVAALDGVDVRSGVRCTDYLADVDGNVTGVAVTDATGDRSTLDADLVVDATGRASRTPAWLDRAGFESPVVDEVGVDVTYGTAVVERPPDDHRGFLVPPSHPRTRGAAVVPVEDDRWQVTLIGVHGDEPPVDAEGFAAFARSLPVPEIGRLVDGRRLLSDAVERYPFPSNRRRRYESLDRFPEGLVVVGDGVASFNPIYGQGMAVAALEARQLHGALADGGRERLAPRFFDRTAPLLDLVWRMAVGADFEYPETTGRKPFGTDAFNRYVARLVRRAHTDGVLSKEFYRVLRLEQSPLSLVRPAVARRVLLPSR